MTDLPPSGEPRPSGRVAVVSHGFHPSVGGSERYHLFIARALRPFVTVEVFTSELNLPRAAGVDPALPEAELPIHYLRSNQVGTERLVRPGALWSALRRFSPSLVWTNQPSPTGDLGGLFALVRGTPWVATYHADTSTGRLVNRIYLRWEARLLRRATIVFVTSRHYGDKLAERGVEPDRIVVVPTGPYIGDGRPPVPHPSPVGGAEGPGDRHPFLFVGALDQGHRYKRLDLLLRALSSMRTRGVPGELLVVGDGDCRLEYESTARELGLGTAVRFLGRVTDPQLADVMSRAWAIVLPANTDAEGLGTAAIEAFQYGCPVVVSSAVPLKELVTQFECGVVYDASDPDALTRGLIQIWSSPETRRRFSNGTYMARRELSWETLMPRLLRPALSLLGVPSLPPSPGNPPAASRAGRTVAPEAAGRE